MLETMLNRFSEALELMFGFGLVLAALVTLWLITELLGRCFRKDAPHASVGRRTGRDEADVALSYIDSADAAAPAAAGDSSAQAAPGVSLEEKAAVAAAVALLLGERVRVVSIQRSSSSWAIEGRRSIHASHRLR